MGVITDNAQRKWEEEQQDELLKLECLKLVKVYGEPNETAMPWNVAQKYFLWIKYGNPDMECK
jgi:hypothetical protein